MQKKSTKIAILSIFTAITVELQILSYFVKIGTFNLSLVLIPIVLIGVLYGPKYSGYLGAVFGIITYIAAMIGVDAGGNVLFIASPLLLLALCLTKGFLAGFLSGLFSYKLAQKNPLLGTFIGAVTAPIVNTGVFLIFAFLGFNDIMYEWANGTNLLVYAIIGLVGINFVIEFIINIILSPIIIRVLKAVKRYTNS